jgi:septum formation protein
MRRLRRLKKNLWLTVDSGATHNGSEDGVQNPVQDFGGYRLILASGSPRRRMLMERFGIACTVVPADIDETPRTGELADAYVARLAIEKAVAVQSRLSSASESREAASKSGVADVASTAVLAADTTVALAGLILGKPEDADDAIRTLRLLSGRTHQVHTGIAVATAWGCQHRVVTSNVTMVELDAALIAWYVGTGEPFDKAGSYAIQERAAAFVSNVEGSMDNVVGLPMIETIALLHQSGLSVSYRANS